MSEIKGINIGGWLLVEGYILGGPNIAECRIKEEFRKVNGKAALEEFEKSFRKNFIKKEDFKNIAETGAKQVRLPFNFRLIEKKPYSYSKNGTQIIKNALDWANQFNLKIILDLHAAPGSQNYDWHGDSRGVAKFWQKRNYRDRATKIWEYLADKFYKHPSLYGYDLLNEPVAAKENKPLIKEYYQQTIKAIRQIDKNKPIFIEGNHWAQDINFLKSLISNDIQISIHTYLPLNYTFNFSRNLDYPGVIENTLWNKSTIHKYLEPYAKFSRKNKVKIFVGEFGINWRGGFWGEKKYLDDLLSVFTEYGFGFTYWTYKAIAGSSFPDGLFQFTANNHYTKREGPIYGWQNYALLWKKEKEKIKKFWRTENFTPNNGLLNILKKHFKGNKNK